MPAGVYPHKPTQGFQKGNKLGKIFQKGERKGIAPWNKGKHLTEETRRRIGASYYRTERRIKQITELGKSQKGKRPKFIPNTAGIKLSETARKNMSNAQKKLRRWGKEKTPGWKGGITSENLKARKLLEVRLWREAVYKRDKYTCQKCGDNRGGNLIAHHIRNFSEILELRTSIENGITLCEKCHILFHKTYGCRNNTKEQLKEFIALKGVG